MTTLIPLLCACAAGATPTFLEDRFELPPGFRIYKAASAKLAGGSYDICFDARGRLLVADGTQIRRLEDRDGDGIFDEQSVIATGLGPRGPQGICVVGDSLYAVGGDGVQLFTGYLSSDTLVHKGRIGAPFSTGGDHDAHTILRGHDGWLYFITGNGGGARDRKHITEAASPVLFERECSVFRVSLDGAKWECIGSGGRNAPNLGLHYLGDFFSLDSDMEWHVDLPWWRPVRIHHWIQGGDQGWQDVGAYPPYSIDNAPGILDVGRGSPCWGVFYEHEQLPEKYRDAFLVCDYLSKSATTGGYDTTGRLFAFSFERKGAGWKPSMEVLARPRPGAKDADGNPISFALVDVEVGPDGSLYVSDHNQGVWRILHDPDLKLARAGAPPIFPAWPASSSTGDPRQRVEQILALPQPASEWSRTREEEIAAGLGSELEPELLRVAKDSTQPLRRRLRAVRLAASRFSNWSEKAALASDASFELRAQAAWLLGLDGSRNKSAALASLLADADPFVRRRALEASMRIADPGSIPRLIELLSDPDRLVRYAAMIAISRFPRDTWLDAAVARPGSQPKLRALVAADLRREPASAESLRSILTPLVDAASPADSKEERLDLLRVLGRFQRQLKSHAATSTTIASHLLAAFPDVDPDIRREQVRLLGEYGVGEAVARLVTLLEEGRDPVEQFHVAQAISRIDSGWAAGAEERAWKWFLAAQQGWFADPAGKGLQFPDFWLTVLADFASRHRELFLRRSGEVNLASQLGGITVDLIAEGPEAASTLIALYRGKESLRARQKIASALGRAKDEKASAFLREEYPLAQDAELRGTIVKSLSRGPGGAASQPIFLESLLHPDREVVRACVRALEGSKLEPTERVTGLLLSQYLARVELFHPIERLLTTATGKKRPGFSPDSEPGRRPTDGEIETGFGFWKAWYEEAFGRPFDPASVAGAAEATDEELHGFILAAEPSRGDAARGKELYVALRCAACHAGAPGPEGPGRIFGPELAGATRRLTRAEVADSLVYPSKVVADRFKGAFVQLKDGVTLTGFVTERSNEEMTLVDPDRVHRLPRSDIALEQPLEESLMPERLLNRSTREQVLDLLAFLDGLGVASSPAASGKTEGDWACLRGPGGRGLAACADAPDSWSPEKNIAWRARLEGWGNSSPAVIGDRVYVTSQTEDAALHAYALDRSTGAILWNVVVATGRKKAHELHNMATPSPAAEGDRVWFLFGTGDFACLDRNGTVLWKRNLEKDHGEYKILWGMGSSPMVLGGLVYTICSHSGPSYVLAVDKATGKDVWKAPRDLPCVGEAADSYSSPVFAEVRGRVELVVSARDHVNAYDPATGRELWISSGLKIPHDYGRTMASPGVGDGIIVACSASVQGLGKVVAVRSDGEGDVSASRLWQYDKFTPDCPSPLCYAGQVYVIRDDGIASCLDAQTGKLHWKKRIPGDFKASPVGCGGKVYFFGMDGNCLVQRAGPDDVVVAENHLDGRFIATPAIAGGRIYIRSKDTVYAVGSP